MTGAAMVALGVSSGLAKAAVTRLRVTWWGGSARAELTQKVVDLYSSKTPGTEIDTEFLGWGDYWPRLSTQIAGGNSPDLLQMDIEFLAEFARRGVLAPLDEFIPSKIDVSDFDKTLLGNGQVDGKQYGVPLGGNAVSMVFNKTAFEEVGIAVPTYDTTWERFAADMAAFAKVTPRKGYVGSPDGSGKVDVLETWLRQQGKGLYTPDRQLGYDEGDITAWFEMWAAMRATGAVAIPEIEALEQGGDIDTALLTQGKTAIAFANSNQLVGYQALSKDALGLTSFPRLGADGKGGLYVKPTMFFSISSQSKIQAAAAMFLGYFLRDPVATAILGVERGISASAAVREQQAEKLDDMGKAMLAYISGLGDIAGELPPEVPAGAGEVTKTLLRVSQQVAFGTQNPAEGAKALVAEARAILARG